MTVIGSDDDPVELQFLFMPVEYQNSGSSASFIFAQSIQKPQHVAHMKQCLVTGSPRRV